MIKVLGPYSAWDDRARTGRLARPDGGPRPVLMHPGFGGSAVSLDQARAEGHHISGLRHAHLLQLLRVMPVSDAPVAIYEAFDGASLRRVRELVHGRGGQLPLRVCFELAAAVADGLGAAWLQSEGGRRVLHPGPTPAHLLVAVNGAVKLVGLRAPEPGAQLPSPSGYRPPEGCGDAPALVYGVGALLVELLGGEPPPGAASRPERHDATLRRAMIRVLARSGPRPPEPAVTLVQSCLSWQPADRPVLASLSERLAEAARNMPEPGLTTWAGAELAQLWPLLGDAPRPPQAPRRVDLPMAVGPLPDGVRLERRAVDAPDPPTDNPTESLRARVIGPDAPTAEETEEVERTQELPDGGGQEVTVSTPRPEAPSPVLDKTVMTARPVDPRAFDEDAATVMAAAPVDPSAHDDKPTTVVAAHITGRWQAPAPPSGVQGVAIGGPEGPGGAALDDPALDDEPLPSFHSRAPLVVVVGAALALLVAVAWWAWSTQERTPDPALQALAALEEAGRDEAPARSDVAVEDAGEEDATADGATAAAGEEVADEAASAPQPAALAEVVPAVGGSTTAATPAADPVVPAEQPAPGHSTGGRGAAADRATARSVDPAPETSAPSAAEDVDVAAAYLQPASAETEGSATEAPATEAPAAGAAAAPAAAEPAPGEAAAAEAAPGEAPAAEAAPGEATAAEATAAEPAAAASAVTPAPGSAASAPQTAGAAPDSSSGYLLEFHAADASVTTLEVECHQGRVGSGRDITIPDAVKGPCRVVGRTADGGKLVASVAVSQSASWTCFQGGVRACR